MTFSVRFTQKVQESLDNSTQNLIQNAKKKSSDMVINLNG